MKEVLVSIVVPVFNAEKYLAQCIDSILKQTLSEIEIIIVNDGSTDGSMGIIEAFLQKDERIIFINSMNSGPGSARNKGMTIARGAYLGFVDADDWIEPGMYETLYHAVNIKNYDLGICNVNQFVETVNVFSNRINLENATMDLHKNKKEELIQFLHFRYDNANWNKLYRCSLIKKYTIRFNETMRLWEDLLFNLVYLQYASTAVIVDKVFYNYRVHAASSMTAQSGKVSENFNKFYSEFIYAASKEGHNELVNTFCQEMNDSFIGNVINAIGIFASKKPGFWGFIQQSSAIFKEVDSRIYLTGNPKKGLVSRINKYLLRHGAFSLLSFLIATRIYSGLKIWTW